MTPMDWMEIGGLTPPGRRNSRGVMAAIRALDRRGLVEVRLVPGYRMAWEWRLIPEQIRNSGSRRGVSEGEVVGGVRGGSPRGEMRGAGRGRERGEGNKI